MVTEEEISAFRQRWLSERALLDPDDFGAWCVANHLRASAFDEFIAARARDSKLAAMAGELVEDFMIDALRVRNEYAALASRAVDKQRTLQIAGAADVDLAGADISVSELVAWFCGERLQSPAPVDAESLAAELGYHSVDALCKALLREHRYLRLTNFGQPDDSP